MRFDPSDSWESHDLIRQVHRFLPQSGRLPRHCQTRDQTRDRLVVGRTRSSPPALPQPRSHGLSVLVQTRCAPPAPRTGLRPPRPCWALRFPALTGTPQRTPFFLWVVYGALTTVLRSTTIHTVCRSRHAYLFCTRSARQCL
jgi:hypothetical protein